MDFVRTLTEGVGSWLHFEDTCNRSGLFGERYLTHPIGQILSSRSGNRAIAEYRHPMLAPLMTGPGRRPEVDFVICDPYPKIKYAVESKWIGGRSMNVQNIIWDMVRLELIAHHEGAKCFFLMVGKRRSLETLFQSSSFSGPIVNTQRYPPLRTNKNSLHKFDLVPTVKHRIPVLRDIFRDYQDIAFPHKIISRRTQPFPSGCKLNQFQVYAWQIYPAARRDTFLPRNSRYYSM
jgi:hypothetical protein